MPRERLEAIYREYIAARQRCNQSTNGLSFDKVASQLRSQEASLRAKHGKDVDFQVTVRNGKAILKAVKRR